MTIKNQSWPVSRLIILSSFVLVGMIAAPRVDATELKNDGPRAQQPDPDSIPQSNPMVVCTVRELGNDPDPIPSIWLGLGEDPDPIPRIWGMSCSSIGDDPDSIPPPTN